MAIATNDAIHKFGTQTAVTTTGALTANAEFTSAGTWTNTDDAPMASAVIVCTIAIAPDAGSVINLYGRLHNVQGTKDQDAPDANYLHSYLGTFPVNDVVTEQVLSIDIPLPNNHTSQVYEFYIENTTGQDISANWGLYVTPKSIGPHT